MLSECSVQAGCHTSVKDEMDFLKPVTKTMIRVLRETIFHYRIWTDYLAGQYVHIAMDKAAKVQDASRDAEKRLANIIAGIPKK